MKQFLKVLCFTALFIMLSGAYYCKADTFDLIENILQPTEIYDYYNNKLNNTQRDICNYLVGCYNSVYLGCRGFIATDNTFSDQSIFITTMRKYGSKIFGFMSGSVGWSSRFNNVLCQYISSCIIYSMQQTSNSFDDWYNNLPSDFYIPYSSDSLNAWDIFYNDNSNDGIQVLGEVSSNWVSGNLYDFAFTGIAFRSGHENIYNNFILNHNPVIYSDLSVGVQPTQLCVSVPTNINALFIQRSNNLYSNYRFGISEDNTLSNVGVYNSLPYLSMFLDSNKINVISSNDSNLRVRSGILTYSGSSSLLDIINYAFDKTPFVYVWYDYTFYYPYIDHVYLVDDLNTLSNPEEVFDTDGFNISSENNYVEMPNNNYNLNINVDLPDTNSFYRFIIINSTDENNNPVSDDDFTPNPIILNLPNSNSYYKPYSPDSPLPSFDIGLFGDAGGQITYFKECAEKFIIYTRQVLDCFSFNDGEEGPALIIVAVLIIGIAGGLVVKMLL